MVLKIEGTKILGEKNNNILTFTHSIRLHLALSIQVHPWCNQ